MEPEAPDPSNSPPEVWVGGDIDDSADLARLLSLTVDEAAMGADLDRVEGVS